MTTDPDDPADEREALAAQFERPATRPIATRTRPAPGYADGEDEGETTSDRAESVDGEPIYTRTRAP
ncbi:MAG: hypothetical protein ACOCPY_00225 [Halorubrum sp.]